MLMVLFVVFSFPRTTEGRFPWNLVTRSPFNRILLPNFDVRGIGRKVSRKCELGLRNGTARYADREDVGDFFRAFVFLVSCCSRGNQPLPPLVSISVSRIFSTFCHSRWRTMQDSNHKQSTTWVLTRYQIRDQSEKQNFLWRNRLMLTLPECRVSGVQV